MIYSIIYSQRAIETYDAITEQIDNRWGSKYVDDFERRTIKVIESIQVSPFIFQAIEAKPNLRKGFIHRNCSLFYEVEETQIFILFFWTTGRSQFFYNEEKALHRYRNNKLRIHTLHTVNH